MAKRSHIDEMKLRRALKAKQEEEARLLSTAEPPDPARMAMQSDYILMRKIVKDRTEAGVILPEGAQLSSIADGVVVAAGPGQYVAGEGGLTLMPLGCKVGDEVMLDPQAPIWGMPGDRTLFATRACHVMAVLKPKSSPLVTA
jgi:co-chaperonin GroES (HSP10)